jgi:IS30 family transposase
MSVAWSRPRHNTISKTPKIISKNIFASVIAEHLNNRPRLRLGFKTPNEAYY